MEGRPEYRDITIAILDRQHSPVVVYKLSNAWPCAYRGPVLTGNERNLALEEVEIAYEGLRVQID
jgi:phage tail-like protein